MIPDDSSAKPSGVGPYWVVWTSALGMAANSGRRPKRSPIIVVRFPGSGTPSPVEVMSAKTSMACDRKGRPAMQRTWMQLSLRTCQVLRLPETPRGRPKHRPRPAFPQEGILSTCNFGGSAVTGNRTLIAGQPFGLTHRTAPGARRRPFALQGAQQFLRPCRSR